MSNPVHLLKIAPAPPQKNKDTSVAFFLIGGPWNRGVQNRVTWKEFQNQKSNSVKFYKLVSKMQDLQIKGSSFFPYKNIH